MERRRGSRIPVEFKIKIFGVDQEFVLRKGNISVTGLYVELDKEIGEPGSLQYLEIAPCDHSSVATSLARIVRISSDQDLWEGSNITGAALEFLPENEESRKNLEVVIRKVVASSSDRFFQEGLQCNLDAHISDSISTSVINEAAVSELKAQDVQVTEFGISGMVIETSFPMSIGEEIKCKIEAPSSGQVFELSGKTVDAQLQADQQNTMYRVKVNFSSENQGPKITLSRASGGTIGQALDSLMDEILFPHEKRSSALSGHMTGSLDRINLASLLSFLELEKLTGKLKLDLAQELVTIYILSGEVIDAVSDKIFDNAFETIKRLISLKSGSFEFQFANVTRKNRLNLPTTALLLEVAKQVDES